MGTVRVGLMGFGRIGRNLLRILYRDRDVDVAVISDPADASSLEYLLRFDTMLGRFPDEVSIREGNLYLDGKRIPFLGKRDPAEIDWAAHEVDVVVEATGKPRSRAELAPYFERGVRKVVLCAPPAQDPDLTVVLGVNDAGLAEEPRIVSNASCTTQAIAPIIKILDEAFGVEQAFVTSVHAYTNQQRLADVPTEEKRRGRAAAENIIPQESRAAEILEKLLPALAGRITATAMSVPVYDGSAVDLVCWHRKPVDVLGVNEVVRTAIASRFSGSLEYEDDPVVSSDILRSSYSGTFDSLATMSLGEHVSKTVTWFDNGWGYAHRAVDLIRRLTGTEAGCPSR